MKKTKLLSERLDNFYSSSEERSSTRSNRDGPSVLPSFHASLTFSRFLFQVYYERINTHAATSFYYYDYCGVKDISKELILDPKVPITKINLSKGFAFSNMRSATEFEEARSRFFAEQVRPYIHRSNYLSERIPFDHR